MSDSEQRRQFLEDTLSGLQQPQKSIPCKYLYDERGSKLFEAICQTSEYYVTRAELALHEQHAGEIAERIGPRAHIIEFGSGSGLKTRKLLANLEQPRAYTPIEISSAALALTTRELRSAFPEITIHPLQADYTQPIDEKSFRLDPAPRRRVAYFPGSTISNFDHDQAAGFLGRMRSIVGSDGVVLVGVDLIKPVARLLAAYDDAEGVTAQFNRNVLHRLRRELGAHIDVDAFDHEARFNEDYKRIEMHLVARYRTRIDIGEHRFDLEPGESIHTENSHKYSQKNFRALAARAGLESVACWKDPEGLFSMHWLENTGD